MSENSSTFQRMQFLDLAV